MNFEPKKLLAVAGIGAASLMSNGCALGLAAGAGAVVADEMNEAKECDDNFDPLEDVRDKEDGCN